ncbi:hypothetical protein HispidOSU_001773, partial [Sigmodon hispidus]
AHLSILLFNGTKLSDTRSTGENGRVMTPEFPKAVHAVPYPRIIKRSVALSL